jgi:hypothetical protein
MEICGLRPLDVIRHETEEVERDRAEAVRLAYVAATRARDLLVVPALGDGQYDGGWLDPLNPAIYPVETARRSPVAAPGCPKFPSMDSVLERPDGDPAKSTTVAPGGYPFQLPTPNSQLPKPKPPRSRAPSPDTYQVVWWDPHHLALDAASAYGLRRDDLIVKDGDMFAVAERLAGYERWKDEKSRSIAGAAKKSIDVETASAWASTAGREQSLRLIDPSPLAFDITIVETTIDAQRPRGRRFGTLVHAVLAAVSLDAGEDDVRTVATMQARILGAGAEELEAAVRAASSVLAHPLLQRARAASAGGRCYREMPVTWRAGDGVVVEGTIDLAFDDDEGATVVDFKTDRELDADAERYRRQLTIYCRALAALRGGTPRGILMRI